MDNKELITLINAVLDVRESKEIPYNPMGKLNSDALDQLAPALSKLQSEVKSIIPNRKNEYLKYEYSDLDAILKEARPLLDKHGLSVVPIEETYKGIHYLRTTLLHASGQYMSSFVELIITPNLKRKSPIQDYGTALSYHKRYSIANLLGITKNNDPLDNDGEDIEKEAPSNKPKQQKYVNNAKPPKKEELLSEGEINFILDEANNDKDIIKDIKESFGLVKLSECPKKYFDTIVEFIYGVMDKK